MSSDVGYDPLSDPEERRVLYAAIDSFRQYRHTAHYNITHLRRRSFYTLPSSHMSLLASPPFSLPAAFDAVDKAIDASADIADLIVSTALLSFGVDQDDDWKGKAMPGDMDKARSTIRQLYRDWSLEAEPERHACYDPILSALAAQFSHIRPQERHQVQVLVPGAGLGRLVFEICKAGWTVEGNEISYHQLLASNFVLNKTPSASAYPLHPWALSFSNHRTRADQFRRVMIPDVHPATELARVSVERGDQMHSSERMSMSSGDFCVIYQEAEYANSFDAITTCFFIDTAPNLIAYIETVLNCLKQGGYWINLGPLLWHFENAPHPGAKEDHGPDVSDSSSVRLDDTTHRSESTRCETYERNIGIGKAGSFELADDEVLALLRHFGFEIVQHEVDGLATGYVQDPESMLQNVYRPSFWIARKMKKR
ncbi:hypothetical protein LTR66_013544 [Elasticomyces elasticus]|nr:hypothetical protein LTR66_013544 [Elasticomyces elasticus]